LIAGSDAAYALMGYGRVHQLPIRGPPRECWHICGDIHVGTADEWQVAMQVLNRHVERAFNPSRKDHHRGRRKLAQDE
jgi:hypothetical protein